MKFQRELDVAIIAGVAVAGIVYLVKSAASKAAALTSSAVDAIATGLDPFDPNNVAARTVNKLGTTITGDPDFSLGSSAYDAFNSPGSITAPTPLPVTTTRSVGAGGGVLLIRGSDRDLIH